METITIRLDDSLAADLNQSLADWANKSAYIREAIKEKIESDERKQQSKLPPPAERTIIYLLLEILKHQKDQRIAIPSDLEDLQTAISEGYEHEYGRLNPVGSEVFPSDIADEVRDILFMHRVLLNCFRDHGEKLNYKENDIRFEGFDGNEEGRHYSYANFVLGSLCEFQESAVDGQCENTHWPIINAYRAMLCEWRKCQNQYKPTKVEFKRILDAKSQFR